MTSSTTWLAAAALALSMLVMYAEAFTFLSFGQRSMQKHTANDARALGNQIDTSQRGRCLNPLRNSPYEEDETDVISLSDNLKLFREYAKRGMKRFKEGNLDGAYSDMLKAKASNTSQPLPQLGIMQYCVGDYEGAVEQFEKDIEAVESFGVSKATEFRLWRAASFNKMSRFEDAKDALDLRNMNKYAVTEGRKLMNETMAFFGEEIDLGDLMEFIGDPETEAIGYGFYGNFYVALYFDSMSQEDMATSFLDIAQESNRAGKEDMWHHIPSRLRESIPTRRAKAETKAE